MATSMILIVQMIATSLGIEPEQKDELIKLVQEKIKNKEIQDVREFSPEINEKIRDLMKSQGNVKEFENNVLKKKYTRTTLNNFNTLKYNLGKLQILVLLKKIEKATNNEDILNMLFTALSNQLKNVNDIMTINLKGGGINMKESDSMQNSSEEKNISSENIWRAKYLNYAVDSDRITKPSENIWRAKYLKYKIKYLELYYKHFLEE